jgi:hypothetical protein
MTQSRTGTLFVLVKKESAVDSLLAAIRDNETDRIKALIKELTGTSQYKTPATSSIVKGKWRLLWTEQADDANWLQKSLAGRVREVNWITSHAFCSIEAQLWPVQAPCGVPAV